tara:strand:+ start:1503 stop:2621 length:1119 start_codon:yes stop_codon:yes gene_type:complete
MSFESNTDLKNIKFLNSNNSLQEISEKYLQSLKKISSDKIDEEAYNKMIDELKNNKFEFKINLQEQNYIKNISENKILEYLIYRYKFKEYPKKKIDTEFPIYVLIEPVSSCNLKCPMCFQSDKSFIKKEFMGKMNFDLYKKIIDECEINGTKAITFGSRGEPTIHPQIKEMLEYASGKFLDIKLITNATKLTDELINTIFKCNLQQVVFSIDSEEKETYERLRKFAKYESVLANVKRYNQIKKTYKNNKTVTRIAGVKVEKQQNEESFYKFWSNFSDEVVFKEAYARWDTYNNDVLEDFLEPCRYIWERMYVWFDGKVNPCDADYKSYLSYGNVKNNTIKEIWSSKEYKKLKETHLNKNRDKITPCDRCEIH